MIDQIITNVASYIASHPRGIAEYLVFLIGWNIFNTIIIFWDTWATDAKLNDLKKGIR